MSVDQAPGERLNRYLARRGVASRRGADLLISAGRVTVNGTAVAPGRTVNAATDRVDVDGKPVPPQAAPHRTLMLNKPVGVLSTRHDPQGRPTAVGIAAEPGLVPVGRLDSDSRGLLLLSNDGELAMRLTHPRYGVPKVYRVRMAQPVQSADVAGLAAGLLLEDGPAVPLDVAGVDDVTLDITMGEGRKREVRRLCAAAHLEVIDLCRIALGPLQLGGLADGGVRPLLELELDALHAAVGLVRR